jgi:hypothetical protein
MSKLGGFMRRLLCRGERFGRPGERRQGFCEPRRLGKECVFGKGVLMRYGSIACGLWFVVGVVAIQAVQSLPAHAQAALGDAAASAHKSSSGASSAREAHKSSSGPSSAREARNAPWSVAEEPYIGAGAPHWRYFVEFRARNAASYGHMYVMFGEVNARHEVIKSEIAGLFPAGDARGCENCSIYNWTIGHVLPVPSEIGASDGDLEEQYVLARFRFWVDAQQYRRLSAYIKERKAHKGPWNALFANCVSFGRDVASFLNLKMPATAAMGLLYPESMVNAIREANGVKREQLPLRDAGGSFSRESRTNGQTKISPAASVAEKTAAQKAAAAESGARTGGPSQ